MTDKKRESSPHSEEYPSSTCHHYAERLAMPLHPEEALELDQVAGRVHRDLQALKKLALGSLEPPLAFRPGGNQTE
jgi:hypothetical protein